jgi:signal transduction histidine kinase
MKMKYNLTIILFSLLAIPAFQDSAGQDVSKSQSLHRVINGMKESPEKADSLLALSLHFYYLSKLDSATTYCDKADSLSTALDYKKGRAESMYRRGLIQNKKTNYIAAIDCFRKYLEMIRPLNDNRGLVKGYYNLGSQLRQQGKFDSAMNCYHQSLAYAGKAPDTLTLIGIYNGLGLTYQMITSQYDSASIYFLKAARLCKSTGKDKQLGLIYINLGKTLYLLGEHDQAKKYLNLAVEINRKFNDNRATALGLTQLGAVFSSENENDSAITYYGQAMELLKPYGDIREVIDLYQNYAVIFDKQGKSKLALEYYSKALKYGNEQKLPDLTLKVLRNIGVVYSKQGYYAKAEAIYDSCLQIAIESGFTNDQVSILDAIFNNYVRWGNYKKAYEYIAKYYDLKDSLTTIDKSKLINELTIKYEKQQDQAKILSLENENLGKDLQLKKQKLQRNAFFYSGITIFALAIFLFLYIQQRRTKDRIIAEQKIKQLEEEKKLMAAKILVEGQEEERKRIATELHDGLGVLLSATKMQFSTIIDKSPENKDLIERATKMLEQASGDVRKISHNMMPGLLTRLGFYEAVEDLFEHVDDTGKLKANCVISGNRTRLPENKEIMLYRIIQELVNNTMKHAEASGIQLQVHILPGILDIIYEDNGKGFDYQAKLESQSLGLKNIQSRVNFLNGSMKVDSSPGNGTRYFINIALT